MARRKADPNEAPQQRRVRQVRTEEFVEVVPEGDDPEEIELEELPADPFRGFAEYVSQTEKATIHIWHLPKYEEEGGIISANGATREGCGSIIYRPDDDSLLQQVHDKAPVSGYYLLEMRIGGKFKDKGVMKILKASKETPPVATQNGAQHIYLPPNPAAALPSPAEYLEQQFSLLERFAELSRKLIPPAPNITVGETNGSGNGNQRDERTFEEKILETVVVKAFESPDKSSGVLDKVLDALGGRSHKEPGFLEGMAPLIGPALAELVKAAVPLIQSYAARQVAALQQPSQAPAQIAATATAPIPDGAPQPERPPAPPIDPVERAWLRVVVRMLEDCEEQVRLAQVSTDKFPVEAAAASVIDVYDRFHDDLAPIIDSVLGAEPLEVFNLVQVILPPHVHGHVQALQQQKAAIEWVGELQTRVKEILAQAEEEGGDDGNAE